MHDSEVEPSSGVLLWLDPSHAIRLEGAVQPLVAHAAHAIQRQLAVAFRHQDGVVLDLIHTIDLAEVVEQGAAAHANRSKRV